jgi:hypothetical protein
MDDTVQPCRPAGALDQHGGIKPFGKDPPPAKRRRAHEAPRDETQANATAGARQIRHLPDITAVDALRRRPAQRTQALVGRRADGQNHRPVNPGDAFDDQPGRDK